MRKRAVWAVASCLVVAAMVLASCAPAPAPAPTPTPAPAPKPTPAKPEPVKPAQEEPKYGGVLRIVKDVPPLDFDEAFRAPSEISSVLSLTNEDLLVGDWAKGPAGTGEAKWVYNLVPTPPLTAPSLAESWELTDPTTMTFHIRKGVRFHDKPPTSGREMTADDVAFTLNRYWTTPTCYIKITYPFAKSITATDKWTVVVKATSPEYTSSVYEMAAQYAWIQPRDMVEKYGNMRDWKNSCGTGPFMLVDYVSGSAARFKRHPNYWGKDPLRPQNQLPYLDGIHVLIIPDASTRHAALRTGKVDILLGLGSEDADSMRKTTPELKWLEHQAWTSRALFMRVDKPELPWYDLRVRRALYMAVDLKKIVDTYYGGHADMFTFPILPIEEFKDIYIPLEKMPESIRELFEYNPDKAKKLLAEAGYPNGFKAEAVCYSAEVDWLSIIKDYWSKIGVDLKLDSKEYSVKMSILAGKTHKQMIAYVVQPYTHFKMLNERKGGYYNLSMVSDPIFEEAYQKFMLKYFEWPELCRLRKEIVPKQIEQCNQLVFPGEKVNNFWWPWVKNYHGEAQIGYRDENTYSFFIWLDQEMKRTMGY